MDSPAKQTHPLFTITCDACGSVDVYVESEWCEVSLVCRHCGATTDLVESGRPAK